MHITEELSKKIVQETIYKWQKQVPYKWWKYLNMEVFQEVFSFSTLNQVGESGGGTL